MLQKHLERHEFEKTGVTPHVCPTCNKCFVDKRTLKYHELRQTCDKPKRRVVKGSWKCDRCDKTLKYEANYKVHILKCTGEDPYPCPQCDRRFKHPSNLQKHLESHEFEKTGVSPHVCPTCNKCFIDKHTLKRHELIHTGDKFLGCTLCEKSFMLKQDLVSHHANVHSDERPYSCSICNASFKQRSTLLTHEKIHTGERNHLCGTCGKSFGEKGSLRRHEKLHTGVKPFTCKVCNKSFLLKFQLTDHERAHSDAKPYPCKFCDREFKYPESLSYHEKVHTGEKPFGCNVCQKQFRIKQQLKDHERKHTGEKPHACATCDKRFACSSSLRKHKKNCALKTELLSSDNDDPYMACFSKRTRLQRPESIKCCPDLPSPWGHNETEEVGHIKTEEVGHIKTEEAERSSMPSGETCATRTKCGNKCQSARELQRHERTPQSVQTELASSDDEDPYMACFRKRVRANQPEPNKNCDNLPSRKGHSETEEVGHSETKEAGDIKLEEFGDINTEEVEGSSTQSGETRATCTKCGRKCRSDKELQRHERTQQLVQTEPPSSDDDDDPYMACFRKRVRVKEPEPRKRRDNLTSPKGHSETEEIGHVKTEEVEGSSTASGKTHATCTKCGKKCRSERELQRHERTRHTAPATRVGLRSRAMKQGSDETTTTTTASADRGEKPRDGAGWRDQTGFAGAKPGRDGKDGNPDVQTGFAGAKPGSEGKDGNQEGVPATDFNENVMSGEKVRRSLSGESRPKLVIRIGNDKCVEKIIDRFH